MKQQLILPLVLVAVVAGAGGFFGGMKYQQSKRGNFVQMGGSGGGTMIFRNGNGAGGARNGFRPVAGEIIKADETSITVKLVDGSSKIILVTDKTTINKAEQGSTSDLTVGASVAVFGSENSDGSVTAQNVQLNPTRMGFHGSPAPTP